MSLTERIEKDFILAYKNKETQKVAVLRMLKAALKNKQIELGTGLSDAEAMDVLIREVKQRKESVRQYTQAGRHDLSESESREIAIIESYLPAALSREEMKTIAAETIQELGVSDMSGMGRVMKAINHKFPGRVDGRELSSLVRELLSP
ncbi:MAG: GatB/YqeY domain-containing protein [Desulfonatronovibrionaceae bacterium]